ncbi:MAG: hypothetical protein RBT34_13815 [Anaerolineaceae bacterium]|jgi:hypothetical protein|nr:hypothetical protein [Anaerolineaceae bacterium]
MSAEISSWMSVILLVIGALLGAVVTFLIAGQRSDHEPDEQTTEPKRKQNNPPPELLNGNFEEAARLWRDSEGRLTIEMNGIAFKTAQEMNPSAQEKANALARNWLAWLGKEAPPTAAPAANPVDDTVLEKLKLGIPASARVSSKPLSILGEENEKIPDIPKESIVVQIDNILQDMLAGSTLEDRCIHLDEGANMGVVVWVGNQSFQGIDQVNDPIIAKVIRKAVTEWERRSVPNR